MAKLNVKFLEVTNGEVEKVELNGSVYAVSEEQAEVGDLLLMQEGGCDIDEGAFYEVTEIDYADDPQFLDNDEDEADAGGYKHQVFKIETPAKKAGLKVGDKIRITGTDKTREVMGSHGFTVGEVLTVLNTVDTYSDRIRAGKTTNSWGSVVHVNDFEVVDETTLIFEELGREVGELKIGDIVQVNHDSAGHKVGTIGVVVEERENKLTDCRVRANGRTFYERVTLIASVERLANTPE